MNELLTSIVLWLSVSFAVPANYEHPRIAYVPPAAMPTMRHRGVASAVKDAGHVNQFEVVAIYDDEQRTIFLPEGWSGKSPAEVSVLVHEMVHHLQNLGQVKFECPAAREKPAYLAQDEWLKQHGRSLEDDFEVDLFTVIVKSACMF